MPLDKILIRNFLKFDKRVLGGLISGSRTRRIASRCQRLVKQCSSNEFSYFNFEHKKVNDLAELLNVYGSDKSFSLNRISDPYGQHTYSDFYERALSASRHSVRRVFECGIGTNNPTIASTMGVDGIPGASLRAWRDYFPNAQIYGADIDEQILFTEDRIQTFHVDQTDVSSVQLLWERIGLDDFDVIIDDGLHTPTAAMTLLEGSFSRLKTGGFYFIEDVHPSHFEEHISNLKDTFDFSLIMLERPDLRLRPDNNLLVIRK